MYDNDLLRTNKLHSTTTTTALRRSQLLRADLLCVRVGLALQLTQPAWMVSWQPSLSPEEASSEIGTGLPTKSLEKSVDPPLFEVPVYSATEVNSGV